MKKIEYKNENYKHYENVMFVKEIEENKEDKDSFRYTISFASPEPYLRWFGYEIIDLERMDLSRLNNNAILLFNHNRDKAIGVVEKAWIDLKENKAYANIRLDDTNQEAVSVKKSIDNGIYSKISFGYSVTEINFVEEKNNEDYYKVATLPFEISIVTIPADDTVNILKKDFLEEKSDFEEKNKKIYNQIKEQTKKMEQTKMTTEVKENNQVKEIAELGNLVGERDLALKFIEEGKSLDEFKAELKAKREKTAPRVITDEIKSETVKEKRFGQMLKDASEARAQLSFRDFNGITVSGKGKELATQHFSDLISNTIDNSILSKVGFNVIKNVIGDVYNFRGISEVESGTHTSEEDVVIDSKTFKSFNYKAVKSRYSLPIKFSHDLLKQSVENIESVILNEGLKQLYNDISDKLLEILINDPTLALNTHTAEGQNFTYKDVIKIQNDVYLDSGVAGSFITTNKTLNELKLTQKFEGTNGAPVYDGTGVMDGKQVINVPKQPKGVTAQQFLLFGDFSKFGVLIDEPEIYINTYPDNKDQFEVKFIANYAGVLTSPIAVRKSEIN